jgi:HEXXH motif-containing protein
VLRGRVRFALADPNPISSTENHPDKFGSALTLGGRPREEWLRGLRAALDAVAEVMPALAEEMDLLLRRVVPVGWHEEMHLSASYREAVGTVYMTLHPDPLTMAAALIHEFQHNKLNLASHLDPLLENAFHPLYPSPVRPDPRPLWGILMAAHAFLPVAAFYRRLAAEKHPLSRRGGFDQELETIDLKNREAMDVLREHARWTPLGAGLMGELDRLDRLHMQERASLGLSCAPSAVHES